MKINKKSILVLTILGLFTHVSFAEETTKKEEKPLKANEIIYENRKIVLDEDLKFLKEGSKKIDLEVELLDKSHVFFKSDLTIKNSILNNVLSSISVKDDVELTEKDAIVTGAKLAGKKAITIENSSVREVKILMHIEKETENLYTHVFWKDASSIKKEEGIVATVEKNPFAVSAEKTPKDSDNYNEYVLIHKINKPTSFEINNVKFNLLAKFN